ncbi:DUF6801 domain-containing protein [Aeromicrobium sp. 179-A 4D2 NHS]|uniref:DUF6801 domain-containing protein n=1 Tax=Aeromicrobium sp. 179-A 4D2 NHS TaxID=3142375 RepID=UPI00399FDDBA
MRLSAPVRRGLRGLAAGTVVAAGIVSLPAAASAAPAKVERVPYACTATNTTIDLSLDGTQQFYVTAETNLPDRVQPGDTVPATDTTLTLDLSVKLVNRLMGPMKVTDVKGSSTTNVDLKGVAPGGEVKTINQQVKGPNGEPGPLVKDWVKLVKDQEVSMVAKGKVDAVPVPEVPDGNGLIYVQTPQSFVLHSEMTPKVVGSIGEADLECVHGTVQAGNTVKEGDPAERVIGTIALGAGCSETDCPLPADSGTGGPGPTDPGSGDGSGTDPEVIDPVVPDDETVISDSGYTWEDTDGDGVADTQVPTSTSAETTSLPATGSPVAAGFAGLFGILLAARLALGARARRTGA